jgi:aspartate aminotransferase
VVQISKRIQEAMFSTHKLIQFLMEGPYKDRVNDPEVCNFVLGNPQEMPLPELTSAMKQWITPQNKDWFAYKDSTPLAQQVVAESLEKRLGVSFSPHDVTMTTGAFPAISLSIAALVNPGDEVIFSIPPWFFYEPIIKTWQANPIKVPVDKKTYDLDLNAIEKAISPKTRIVIVNSPHNPTGKIYGKSTLKALSALLTEASKSF